MKDEEEFSIGLGLALGSGEYKARRKENNSTALHADLSFKLCPSEDDHTCLKFLQHDLQDCSNKKLCESSDYSRKKLRLTKDQSALLEHTFKLHKSLNPARRQALAEELNLKPRQVEVWFQNRRARTKSKQTEVDCGILKKYCESLRDENQRLKTQVQELKSLKAGGRPSPFCGQIPKLRMCSSCEKIVSQK